MQTEIAAIALEIRDRIESLKPYIGLIQSLRNPGMKPRHFEELSARTGIQMALTPALTLKALLVLGIENFRDIVDEVSQSAAKEYTIEGTLDKMSKEWETIAMEVTPYKDTGNFSPA